MTVVRYAPGPLRAVVAAGGVVVLSGDTPDAVAEAVWRQLGSGGGLAGVVDALAAGGPLSAIPPFAVALEEPDGWRVAVRGPLAVAAGDERVDGQSATTWAERSIRAAETLTLGDADGAAATLPLCDGVVGAAHLALARGDEPAAAGPARPAGAAAPSEPVQPHNVTEVHDGATDSTPGPKRTGRPRAAASAPPVPPAPAAALAPPATPPAPPAPGPLDDATPATGTPVLDDDVEATIIRGSDGEEDATISLAEARALRAAGQLPPVAPPLAPPPAPRAAGVLRVSSGQTVLIDRAVILGRRPRSTRASGTDLPHLVAVDSPQQDISRNHVEVRAEGDTILATDLDTTNGTTLLRRGSEPVRLHPGEATMIVPGDVLDLGDGITVAVEDAP